MEIIRKTPNHNCFTWKAINLRHATIRMKLTINPRHFFCIGTSSRLLLVTTHAPYARAIPCAAAEGPGPSFIAGATNDIGRAIAYHRVASGPGLVLFDRNPDKLAAVGGLAVRLEALKGSIRGHDDGVLVNNADVSYPYT
jgi:hypothetical protein